MASDAKREGRKPLLSFCDLGLLHSGWERGARNCVCHAALRKTQGKPEQIKTKWRTILFQFKYDPAYGLADETRTYAVIASIAYGTKKAAEKCNVSAASIYKWRSDLGLNNKEKTNA